MTCALLLDMFFTAADLARLRRCLTDTARLAGLAEPRRGEFVLAVHEGPATRSSMAAAGVGPGCGTRTGPCAAG